MSLRSRSAATGADSDKAITDTATSPATRALAPPGQRRICAGNSAASRQTGTNHPTRYNIHGTSTLPARADRPGTKSSNAGSRERASKAAKAGWCFRRHANHSPGSASRAGGPKTAAGFTTVQPLSIHNRRPSLAWAATTGLSGASIEIPCALNTGPSDKPCHSGKTKGRPRAKTRAGRHATTARLPPLLHDATISASTPRQVSA